MSMKKVPGTKYAFATEDGRIWSSYWRRFLRPYENHAGYLCVEVAMEDGSTKGLRVNRMVAMAFHPNPDQLPEVNHKNKDRADNAPANLEWCTAQQNSEHASGVFVRLVDPDGMVHESPSIRRLCRELGLNFANIQAVLNGRVAHAEGWRNADTCSGPFQGRMKRKHPVALKSPEGEVHQFTNARAFALANGLKPAGIADLISGRRKSHKGWVLAEDLMYAIYGERRAA